jgi:predicted N-acyltransferase
MRVEIVDQLSTIKADDWNRMAGDANPFVQHAFLTALEQHRCLHEYGWYPQHIIILEQDEPVAAMPMYIKDNSYGELVFDWAWADAYHRSGLPYYPKLVVAIPYTPATGPRLLVRADRDFSSYAKILIEHAVNIAQQQNMSSIHWLFTDQQNTAALQNANMMLRLGCQFHWHNRGYQDFDHYLQAFSSSKRKKIKRERRRVQEQAIDIEIRHGADMTEELWHIYHDFYCDTFDRKSGMPTLSLDFFQSIGANMPDNIVIVFAQHQGKYVASAFNIRGKDALYGRHWGCSAEFHSLHFEACYYQGLEYCINNRIATFEPGAQGEHKISRGFLPTKTWSAHWVAHSDFDKAIRQFVLQEQKGMQHYINSLAAHSPFKE